MSDELINELVDQEPPTLENAAGHSGVSRRTFCVGIGASAVLFGLGALKLVPSKPHVRPPGAQDEASFLAKCIRCERCVEACPHHVLVFQHMEDGFLGARTPVMSFKQDYCTACVDVEDGVPRCQKVCPTQAIDIPAGVKPEQVVIGCADIQTEQCLAYRLAGCRFCYDACPFGAIEMNNGRPVVIPEKCTGCGACEAVCVSLKEGSIASGATRRAIAVVR